jgi:hypothetical protein
MPGRRYRLLRRGCRTGRTGAGTRAHNINASAGLLIQTFDLPGIGIFLGLSSRFPRLFRFAVPGILLGIALRATAHSLLF